MAHLTGLSSKVTDIRLKELEKEVRELKKAQITDGGMEGGTMLYLTSFGKRDVVQVSLANGVFPFEVTGGFKSTTGYLYLERRGMPNINCGYIG